jgi:hypothetical protein
VKTCAVFLTGVLSCFAAMASDEKPNFSGVWTSSEAGCKRVSTIEHHDPDLKVTDDFRCTGGSIGVGGGGSDSYTVDGVEKTSTADNGRISWTSVNWQGSSLVLLRVVKDGYHVTVNREAWTLSQDGRTLTMKFRTVNMDGVTEYTRVFQKQ